MKVWSGVKSILDQIPFTVKFYIGFALFWFLLMGAMSLNAYIKRPGANAKPSIIRAKTRRYIC